MNATKHKPCPFCGSSDVSADEISPRVWAVCCHVCKTIGPESEAGIEQAYELWAARHDTKAQLDWLSQALNEGDGVYRP